MERSLPEERMILDRGLVDSNAHYVASGDAARLEPLGLTFSCRGADTRSTQLLIDLLSGATVLVDGGITYPVKSRKAKPQNTDLYGPRADAAIPLPNFSDTVHRNAYMVEVLWSGTSNWGFRWDEVYFPAAEQVITENEDSLTLGLNGRIYGGVTLITAFSSAGQTIVF